MTHPEIPDLTEPEADRILRQNPMIDRNSDTKSARETLTFLIGKGIVFNVPDVGVQPPAHEV